MSKKKVNKNKVGIAIMFIFTIIGIIFIILGLKEYKSVKNEYSEERIEQKLITLKSELNNQNNKIEEQRDKAVDERTTYINELNDFYNEEGTCYALKDHIGILVDGTIVPCCLDVNGIIKLGNILNDDLSSVINTNRYKKMLIGFNNNKKCEDLCKKCNFLK